MYNFVHVYHIHVHVYIPYMCIVCNEIQGAELRKIRSEVAELKKMVVTTKSKTESLATQVLI